MRENKQLSAVTMMKCAASTTVTSFLGFPLESVNHSRYFRLIYFLRCTFCFFHFFISCFIQCVLFAWFVPTTGYINYKPFFSPRCFAYDNFMKNSKNGNELMNTIQQMRFAGKYSSMFSAFA